MAASTIPQRHIWTPDRKYTIYRIRNTVNGRCYVGSTFDPPYRFYMHRWALDNGSHQSEKMIRDWQDHRSDAFAFEILETDIAHVMRFTREQYWIDAERAYPDGYNSTPEAQSTRGKIHTEEERRVTSEATKRQFAKPGARRKTSIATRAAMADPELRRRLSESARRKWSNPEYRRAMRRKRLTGMSSPALAEASREARRIRERERAKRRKWTPKPKLYHYRITEPDGTVLLASEVRAFCRQHGIWPSAAYEMMQGKRRPLSAKGFKFERLPGPLPAVDNS